VQTSESKLGVNMAESQFEKLIKSLEELQKSTDQMQQLVAKPDLGTNKELLLNSIDGLHKTIFETHSLAKSMETVWEDTLAEGEKLATEKDNRRLMQLDPRGWFDDQKHRIEEQWMLIEEEKAKVVQGKEEIRDKVATLNIEMDKRKALKKEITLWSQNMGIFVFLLVLVLILNPLIPQDYRTPFIISMIIFTIFPFLAVVITTYNIFKY
jgi:hypothetical protein